MTANFYFTFLLVALPRRNHYNKYPYDILKARNKLGTIVLRRTTQAVFPWKGVKVSCLTHMYVGRGHAIYI